MMMIDVLNEEIKNCLKNQGKDKQKYINKSFKESKGSQEKKTQTDEENGSRLENWSRNNKEPQQSTSR